MLLYQPVNIGTAWDIIRTRYQLLMPTVDGQRSYIPKNNELMWIGNILSEPMNQITQQKHQIKSAIIFGQSPGNIQGIHVDGFSQNREGASNWALNIPIVEVGEMQWFEGKYSLSERATDQGLKYLNLTWLTEPKLVTRTLIRQPTIVRIDVPHQVVNQSKIERRLILSVRFTPDIFEIDKPEVYPA